MLNLARILLIFALLALGKQALADQDITLTYLNAAKDASAQAYAFYQKGHAVTNSNRKKAFLLSAIQYFMMAEQHLSTAYNSAQGDLQSKNFKKLTYMRALIDNLDQTKVMCALLIYGDIRPELDTGIDSSVDVQEDYMKLTNLFLTAIANQYAATH